MELREPVEEAEGDLLELIDRVPLALPVPVFEEVIVDVWVAVFLMVEVSRGEREILGLAEEVFEGLTEAVPLELLEEVLEAAIERDPLGQLDDVFEDVTDPVVVLEDVVVFVAVVVDVIVLVTIAVTVSLGLALDVLDAIALRESNSVAFMLCVVMILGVGSHVGRALWVRPLVLVDVFVDVGLRVGTTFASMSSRGLISYVTFAELWLLSPTSAKSRRDTRIPVSTKTL